MSNDDGRRSTLDRAIDHAVHDMMQVDPRPGLRQRVLHRLQDTPHRRGWFGAGALATAAVLVVLFATTLDRRSELQPAPPGQAAVVPSAEPGTPIPGPQTADDKPELTPPSPAAAAKRVAPTPESIFGPRTDQVRGASTGAPAPSSQTGAVAVAPLQAPASGTKPESGKEPASVAQLTNLKLDITITDDREGVETTPKTVSLVTADRQRGRLRSSAARAVLNVDAHPEILGDGRIRVFMTIDYRAVPQTGDKQPLASVEKTITAILEEGKTLNVSKTTDPGTNRTVTVDVKAAVVK